MKSFSSFKSIDEQINEVLSKDATAGDWISDFIKSDNPKFAGKSEAKRKEMALAAYYAKQRNEGTMQPNGTDKIIPDEGMCEGLCQVCGATECKEHFYKSPAVTGYVKEEAEHTVHVDDGSKYDEEPHPKDAEHVMSGVKKHGGKFAGHSDKGAYFKFGSRTDAKNFVDHVKKSPHRSVSADLHESRGHKKSLDEISKDTLGNYVHKSFSAGNELHKQIKTETDPEKKAKLQAKLSQRNSGVIKAAKKMRNEDLEEQAPVAGSLPRHTVVVHVSDPREPNEPKQRKALSVLAVHAKSAVNTARKHFEKKGWKVHSSAIKEDISVDEAVSTVKKDASGKVVAWSYEGDWENKSTKNKQGTGKAANLAGQALQKTKRLKNEEVEYIEEGAAMGVAQMIQLWLALSGMAAAAAAPLLWALLSDPRYRPEIEKMPKGIMKKVLQKLHASSDRWLRNMPDSKGTMADLEKWEAKLDEEVELEEGLFDNMPNTKAGFAYKDKKRSERQAEHEKQDPKMAVHYAKNMVDTAKAAKKAKERGITKHADDFGWQVRNGVQRGKLPEEVDLDEAIDKEHPIYKEYQSLKKMPIKDLRDRIKQQHRIVDTSEFTSKEHAASHILHNKHGSTRMKAVFGESLEQIDEVELVENDLQTLFKHEKAAGFHPSAGTDEHYARKVGNKIHIAAHDDANGHYTHSFNIKSKGGGDYSVLPIIKHKSKAEAIAAVNKRAGVKEEVELVEFGPLASPQRGSVSSSETHHIVHVDVSKDGGEQTTKKIRIKNMSPGHWKRAKQHAEKFYKNKGYTVHGSEHQKVVDDSGKEINESLQESAHVYDTKTGKVHSTHDTYKKAVNAMNKLNDKHQGYDTPGGLVQDKFGTKRVNEDLDESAWGNDKSASLRQAHDRHMEKALAANKAGDDEAVKTHQRKMQMIQGKLQKLKRNEEVELGEECEILSELSKATMRSYLEKGITKGIQDTFAGKGDISKKREAGLNKAMKKVYGEEVEELDELSKGTLASYVKKASVDAGDKRRQDKNVISKTANKRYAGINKAVNKLTKEDSMLTYSEFMASIAEGRIDDLKDKLAADRERRLNKMDYSKEKEAKNPITKVKGHSYGAGEEEGESDDDNNVKTVKPAAVKKGRGRPAGSKSGARA